MRFVHLFKCTKSLFLFITGGFLLHGCTTVVSLYSSVEHLGSFQYLIITNESMNSHINFLSGHMLLFLFDKYIGVEWPNHVVDLCLAFKKMVRLFSKVVIPPTSKESEFHFHHLINN